MATLLEYAVTALVNEHPRMKAATVIRKAHLSFRQPEWYWPVLHDAIATTTRGGESDGKERMAPAVEFQWSPRAQNNC